MFSASQVRRILSWMAYVGAIVVALVSAGQITSIVQMYGLDYPLSLVDDLPSFTTFLLAHVRSVATVFYALVVGALIGGVLIMRFGVSADTKAHGATLVAALLYHLVLMIWVCFVIGFFVLPKAKAGI